MPVESQHLSSGVSPARSSRGAAPAWLVGERAGLLTDRNAILLLAIAATLVGIVVSLAIRMTAYPPPLFSVNELVSSGHVTSTFLPLAYPLFLFLPFKYMGMHGAEILQIFLHIALTITAFLLARRLHAPTPAALIGALLVAFNPDMATGITKILDVPFSTELLLLILLLSLHLWLEGNNLGESKANAFTALLALACAAGISTRPNFLLLLPIVLFAVARRRKLLLVRVAAFGALTAVFFAGLAIAEHGSYFFPRNGPYNLYAGQNHLSIAFLRENMNAEFSIAPAYKDATGGFPPEYHGDQAAFRDPSFEPWFKQQSVAFAREHPAEELKLVGYKLYTFFRPWTVSHKLLSVSGVFKICLAAPACVYLALLLTGERDRSDLFVLVFMLLYLAPFLISNSDPRFRLPLDVIFVLAILKMLAARVNWSALFRRVRVGDATEERVAA